MPANPLPLPPSADADNGFFPCKLCVENRCQCDHNVSIAASLSKLTNDVAQSEGKVHDFEQQLKSLSRLKNKAGDDAADGLITADEFNNIKNDCNTEMENITREKIPAVLDLKKAKRALNKLSATNAEIPLYLAGYHSGIDVVSYVFPSHACRSTYTSPDAYFRSFKYGIRQLELHISTTAQKVDKLRAEIAAFNAETDPVDDDDDPVDSADATAVTAAANAAVTNAKEKFEKVDKLLTDQIATKSKLRELEAHRRMWVKHYSDMRTHFEQVPASTNLPPDNNAVASAASENTAVVKQLPIVVQQFSFSGAGDGDAVFKDIFDDASCDPTTPAQPASETTDLLKHASITTFLFMFSRFIRVYTNYYFFCTWLTAFSCSKAVSPSACAW